jgi:hypothetical protein
MGVDWIVRERRGAILESLFVHSTISVLNSGAPTYLSVIEEFASSPLLLPFLSWVVLEDLHGSDHYPILISLEESNSHPPTLDGRPVLRGGCSVEPSGINSPLSCPPFTSQTSGSTRRLITSPQLWWIRLSFYSKINLLL